MAILNKSVLGDLSGKVGNFIAYKRKGKTIIAKPPDKYPTRSRAVIENRRKFAEVNRFVLPIYRIPLLKAVWNHAVTNDMSAYTTILKLNLKHFVDNHPTKLNVITPPGGEPVISDITYSSGKLKVNLLMDFTGKLVVCIVPFNPLFPGLRNFKVIKPELQDVSKKEFEVKLIEGHLTQLNQYSDYVLFASVIDERNGNIRSYSASYSTEGKLQ